MANADTARLCVQIIYRHFGALTSVVAATLLVRGRLSFTELARYSSLRLYRVQAAILVLIQHNVVWHAQADGNEVFEVNTDECLARLRFGRYVWQAEKVHGSQAAEIIQLILDHGKLRPPEILSRLSGGNKISSKEYSKTLHTLVDESYLKPSTALSHISPLEKRIQYEAEEKGKISGFPTAKELREAKELAANRLRREEEADMGNFDTTYFRVNFDKFNVYIRNKIIEDAARERFNQSAAAIMRTTLQLTEAKQKTTADIRSDAVSAAQITMRLREEGNFTSGLVHSSSKQSLAVSVKTYLAMLAFVDNPMPSGRAASFLSMTSAKVYVEFAIINARLRRGILEAVTRERHGESGVRILRLLLDTGKLDEKQISRSAMMSPKDVRPLLAVMSAESLISVQEVPKSADRNPTRTFYLWYVDLQKAYSVLLVNLYKTLYNIGMRRRAEGETSTVRAVLEKRERSDVSQNESLLTRNELDTLQEWRSKRERLTVLELRVDDAVFILRDLGSQGDYEE